MDYLLIYYLAKRRRRQQRQPISPYVSSRLLCGEFVTKFTLLREDERRFFKYFKMSTSTFDELFSKLEPYLKHSANTLKVRSVSIILPIERLAITARLRRGTRRRQGDNFTHEADERTVVYKSVQLMFHAYYASQSRLEALRTVVQHIEYDELFLMSYAFKKMETWLAAAKTMYYQVVTEHNREVARPRYGYYAAYEKYGAQMQDPAWQQSWAEWFLRPLGWASTQVPLYKSALPRLNYPDLLPLNVDNLTVMHIHHQQLLVWRNYTLAVHLMIDVSYTCEFVEYLNERLRKAFKLDEDENPIN